MAGPKCSGVQYSINIDVVLYHDTMHPTQESPDISFHAPKIKGNFHDFLPEKFLLLVSVVEVTKAEVVIVVLIVVVVNIVVVIMIVIVIVIAIAIRSRQQIAVFRDSLLLIVQAGDQNRDQDIGHATDGLPGIAR